MASLKAKQKARKAKKARKARKARNEATVKIQSLIRGFLIRKKPKAIHDTRTDEQKKKQRDSVALSSACHNTDTTKYARYLENEYDQVPDLFTVVQGYVQHTTSESNIFGVMQEHVEELDFPAAIKELEKLRSNDCILESVYHTHLETINRKKRYHELHIALDGVENLDDLKEMLKKYINEHKNYSNFALFQFLKYLLKDIPGLNNEWVKKMGKLFDLQRTCQITLKKLRFDLDYSAELKPDGFIYHLRRTPAELEDETNSELNDIKENFKKSENELKEVTEKLNDALANAAIFIVRYIHELFKDVSELNNTMQNLCTDIFNQFFDLSSNDDKLCNRFRNALWLADLADHDYDIDQILSTIEIPPDLLFTCEQYETLCRFFLDKQIKMSRKTMIHMIKEGMKPNPNLIRCTASSDPELQYHLNVFDVDAAGVAAAGCTHKQANLCKCNDHEGVFFFIILVNFIGQLKAMDSQIIKSFIKTVENLSTICIKKERLSSFNIDGLESMLKNSVTPDLPQHDGYIKEKEIDNTSETFQFTLIFLNGKKFVIELSKRTQGGHTMNEVEKLIENNKGINLRNCVYFKDEPVSPNTIIDDQYHGEMFNVVFDPAGPSNIVVLLVAIIGLSVDSANRMHKSEKKQDRGIIGEDHPCYCWICMGWCCLAGYAADSDANIGLTNKLLQLASMLVVLNNIINSKQPTEFRLSIEACYEKSTEIVIVYPEGRIHRIPIFSKIHAALVKSDQLLTKTEFTKNEWHNAVKQAKDRVKYPFQGLDSDLKPPKSRGTKRVTSLNTLLKL